LNPVPGNLRNWWEPETMDNFLKKTECIIWQYGNYTAEEINVKLNGINTQGPML
jgi:membrane metallo-endopeptidase-like protein 1